MTIKATVEAAHVPWRPLGELFVSRGLISEGELETALAEQAATGKRLGEILVDGGLVSGPDLTSALMDQLGVEISKEEGFGSGLWAEIKRRHKRVRPEGEDIDDDMRPDQSLLHVVEDDEPEEPEEPEVEYDHAVEPDPEPEPFTPPPAAAVVPELFEPELVAAEPFESEAEPFEPEPELEPELVEFEREPAAPEFAQVAFAAGTLAESEPIEAEPFVLADPELEHELEEIKAEYAPPAPIESFSEPEPEAQEAFVPEHQFAEPELVEYEQVPAPIVAVEPVPVPQSEPAPAADEPTEPTVAEYDDTTELRAELGEARAELTQLQEMLADAMTALAALSAEAARKPYES